ncbi:hypothetical protein [Nocardioides zhouii]|uniref:Uncharacterized protein n=1 Tax=Nocardioides zhouii TaxID=1168729 RepID=A0A4Q2TCX5_9ACTN|nr:hypothetical protein [Nocardioides zhouii]RYC14799.1 hypothetical protein EUA94_01375 [Nocardioides zhouii]
MSENVHIPGWIRQPGQIGSMGRVAFPIDALDQFLASDELRDLLDPEITELHGARDWKMRRAEALESIGIVSRAAGQQFESREDARKQLFEHASGGGFGIRDWLQDAVMAILIPRT